MGSGPGPLPAALAGAVGDLDPALVELALTHRSYCAEHVGTTSNERLEFLGDAVLGLVIAEHLYVLQPGLAEGDLARMRSAIVSTAALAPAARAIGVGAALRLGRGEESSGGREKASLLADAFEALVGAAFVDKGFERARALVLELLAELVATETARAELGDAKNRLQELAIRGGAAPPRYVVVTRGPDHDRTFRATVDVAGVTGSGEGTSKRRAEREAAVDALEQLSSRPS